MTSIITGDIVHSRSAETPDVWLLPLKNLLEEITSSRYDWDVYRGDSFQVEIDAENSLRAALLIKAEIKKIRGYKLDVRMAIGMGETDHTQNRVSESTGEAFEYSGKLLDELTEEKKFLGIKTPWPSVNEEFNLMFRLALVIMNGWTHNTAEVVYLILKNSGITQTEMAKDLGIAQSTVNDRIKRGSVYEIIKLEAYFRKKISEKLME